MQRHSPWLTALSLMAVLILATAPAHSAPGLGSRSVAHGRATGQNTSLSSFGRAVQPTTDAQSALPAIVAGRWTAPLSPSRIVRPFHRPEHRWASGHRGIDLRSTPGQMVRAIGAGRVRFAGTIAGRGVVVVDHGALRSTYEPITASVRSGQSVARGQGLGRVGTGTGHCGAGRCLHLGVIRGSDYVDPLLLLGGRRVVLAPW